MNKHVEDFLERERTTTNTFWVISGFLATVWTSAYVAFYYFVVLP